MADTPNFEIPSDHEKLSYKFILDTLKHDMIEEEHAAAEPEAEPAPIEEGPDRPEIPELNLPVDKKYFRIGEVSQLVGVEPYVLRYWESEFKLVRPSKTSSGQRVYRRRDVEMLHLIRHLLHVEKYSIKGAKKKLRDWKQTGAQPSPSMPSTVSTKKHHETLKTLAQELRELIQIARASSF